MSKDLKATAFQCGGACNKKEAEKTSSRVTISESVKRMAGMVIGATAAVTGALFVANKGNPDVLRWAGAIAFPSGAILSYLSIEGSELERKFKAALPKVTGKVAKMVGRFQKAHRATYTEKGSDGKTVTKHLSLTNIMNVMRGRGAGK